MTVQTGAVPRNLGDLSATDRPSAFDSGGLIFDLVAMAAKLPGAPSAKANSIDASAMVDAVAGTPVAEAVQPTATLIQLPVAVNSLAAIDAEAAPVSFDALVAMDKTAKQGLESKAFSPKPETEWSINIIPAADKPVVELVPLTISSFKPASNPGVELTTSEAQARLTAIDPASISEKATLGEAETKAVTSPASEAIVPAALTPITSPEASLPAAVNGTQPIEAQQPSSDGTSLPALPTPQPVPSVTVEPLAAMPIEQTPVVSIPNTRAAVPNAPVMASSLPLASATPLKSTELANTDLPAPAIARVTPMFVGLKAKPLVVEQPITVLAPSDEALDSTAPFALQPTSGVAGISIPDTVISSEPDVLLPVVSGPTMAANDKAAPVRSADPLASDHKTAHASVKDTDGIVADPMIPTDAPLLPAMFSAPTMAATPVVQNSGDVKVDSEMLPVSDEGKAPARAARRGDWKKPDFSIHPAPDSPIATRSTAKSANVLSASTSGVNPQLVRTEAASSGNASAENNSGEAATSTLLTMDASSSDQRQGRGDQEGRQTAGEAADGTFERLADNAAAPAHQAAFNETITKVANNLSSSTLAMANGLPSDVTIETISIQSQGKADEKTHSIADSATPVAQAAPTLSVFAESDHSSEVIVDTSTFRSNSSISTTPPPPTNGTAATSTAMRADNPGLIAQRDHAMEQQIIAALRGGHDEIRLALYPAQLGQVTINMALDGQKVRIGMKTTNREASTVLLGERQSLVTSLGHEGFTLDGFDVTDDQPREQSPQDQTIHYSPTAVQSAPENSFSLDITI